MEFTQIYSEVKHLSAPLQIIFNGNIRAVVTMRVNYPHQKSKRALTEHHINWEISRLRAVKDGLHD